MPKAISAGSELFDCCAPPSTLARPTPVTPKTQRARPIQFHLYMVRFRKVIEKSAQKTMDEPRSICQTLAGIYSIPAQQSAVAARSKAAGKATRQYFVSCEGPLRCEEPLDLRPSSMRGAMAAGF